MGSSAPVQPKSPSIKRQKSKVVVPTKQKDPQQPIKPAISQVAIKQTVIPLQLSQQKTKQIQELKRMYLIQFQNRFLLKVSKKQIRLIFKPSEFENSSLISSNLHNGSLKALDRKCFNDLQIYSEICHMKLKCVVTEHIKDPQQNQQAFIQVKQLLKKEFSQAITHLLGQIEGKTNIWYSLNLPQKQKITNLINFLHQQGVDSSVFDVIKQKESIIYQI